MRVREWLSRAVTFEGAMAGAEIIDAYRIFPRIVLLYVVYAILDHMFHLLLFFFNLPSADKALGTVVAFVGTVTGVHGALLTAVIALYNASARDWAQYHARKSAEPQKMSITQTTTTQATGVSQ